MPTRRALLLATAAWSLTACAGQAPPPSPFKPGGGPHEVLAELLDFRDEAQSKGIPIRIAYPRDLKGAPYPVVVFSPGGGSTRDDYTRVGDHWASHGYVVISMTHMDSRAFGFDIASAGGPAMQKVTLSRMADMRAVAQGLDAIAARFPDLKPRMDKTRLVASGHSMGGGTAMIASGLKLKNKASGAMTEMNDIGFKALLLISDPGKNPMLPDEPWMQVAKPTFIYTGTTTSAEDSKTGKKSPYGNSVVLNTAATSVPKTYLFVEGVNHYLGGLICRADVPGPQDYVGLAALNGASTAFLDATMKGDFAARRFISDPAAATIAMEKPTDGRATLSRR